MARQVRQLDRQEGRAETMSVPFKVTVLNTGSQNEFGATNKNNSFKNRLPNPITLNGNWRVGLESISLPNSTTFASKLNPGKRNLFHHRYVRRRRNPGPSDSDLTIHLTFTDEDLKTVAQTVDGVGFMKSVFNQMEQWRMQGTIADNYPCYSYNVNGEDQHTYSKWKWDGEELVSDNALTYKAVGQGLPFFLIDLQLGLKMGWFILGQYGQYDLGPNLKQELFDPNMVPDINGSPSGDVQEPLRSGHSLAGKYVFWTANDAVWGRNGTNSDNGYVRLSHHCNWRFSNLNAAFEEVVGSGRRTLMCYSNVAVPAVVGGQNTDILREFDYGVNGSGTTYFEPTRVQYMKVRSNRMDIIEVEIAEKTGKLAQLAEGTTTVTLSFIPG